MTVYGTTTAIGNVLGADEQGQSSRVEVAPSQAAEVSLLSGDQYEATSSYLMEGVQPFDLKGVKEMYSPKPDVDKAFYGGMTVEETARYFQEQKQKADQFDPSTPYAHQLLIRDTADFNPSLARWYQGNAILQEEFANRRDRFFAGGEEDNTWLGWGVDFADRYLLRYPLLFIETVLDSESKMGQEVFDKLSTMNEAEQRTYINELLDRVENEGVLKGNNAFAYMDRAANFGNAGLDENRDEDLFLLGLDIVGLTVGSGMAARTGRQTAAAAAERAAAGTATTRTVAEVGTDLAIRRETSPVAQGTDMVRVVDGEVLDPALKVEGPNPRRRTNPDDIEDAEIIEEGFPVQPGSGPVSHAGNISGARAANSTIDNVVGTGSIRRPNIHEEVQPDAYNIRRAWSDNTGSDSRLARILQQNRMVQRLVEMNKRGNFDRVLTKDQIDNIVQKQMRNISNTLDLGMARMQAFATEVTGIQDGIGIIRIGNSQGDGMSRSAAYSLAAKAKNEHGMSVKVRRAERDGEGYFVEVSERFNPADYVDAAELSNFKIDGSMLGWFGPLGSTVGKLLGSSRMYSDEATFALWGAGETAGGQIAEFIKREMRPYTSLKRKERRLINEVVSDLRDGPDAGLVRWYSDIEFREKYRAKSGGETASDKVVEGYEALISANDFTFFVKSTRLVNDLAPRGFKGLLVDGDSAPGRSVSGSSIGRSTMVWDETARQMIDGGRVPRDKVAWELLRPIEIDGQEVTHVYRPRGVRELMPDDVLNYNAGGPRVNPRTKYFVTIGDGRGRALLGAVTEQQARKAADELDRIFKALRRSGGVATREVDDVVRRNNGWNPRVGTAREFLEIAQRKGWNINSEDKIGYKFRDQKVEGEIAETFGGTYDDWFAMQHHRQNDVLMSVGGADVFNYAPDQAIAVAAQNSVQEVSYRHATRYEKIAWLKRATGLDTLPRDKNINEWFDNFNLDDLARQSDRQELAHMRNVVNRRENRQFSVNKARELTEQMQEFIFDKTGLNIPTGGFQDKLLQLAFHSFLGLGNISQFPLQMSNAFMISFVSSQGWKGAALALPMRLAFMAGDKRQGAKALAKAKMIHGLDEDEIFEIMEVMELSGRHLVEYDHINRGVGADVSWSGVDGLDTRHATLAKAWNATGDARDMGASIGKGVLKLGLVPFNEGERFARWTGIITAAMERKAAGFTGRLTDPENLRAIRMREKDLNLNMTNSARGAWQDGLLKLPTQFLSYTMRVLEMLIAGRGFTKWERGKAAIALTMMGGLYQFGPLNAADQITEQLGFEPNSKAFTTLNTGVIDGFLSWGLEGMTGEEIRTSLGSRIGFFRTFFDLYDRMTGQDPGESNFIEVLAGPGATTGFDIVKEVFGALNHAANGRPEHATAAMQRLLQTPTGVSNLVKGVGIMQTGVYKSRSGTKHPGNFSEAEGLLQITGINNQKVTDHWERVGKQMDSKKSLDRLRKDLQKMSDRAREALALGDLDSHRRIREEQNAVIHGSGLSLKDRMNLQRSLLTGEDFGQAWEFMMREFNRTGSSFSRERAAQNLR